MYKRQALEAVNNVVRHAAARTCAITVQTTADHLTLTVSDDGIGLPADRPAGIGLRSMRERAEEVGGGFTIENLSAGGARVTAVLPL